MLDLTNLRTAASATSSPVFLDTDPTQAILRDVLARMTDAELQDVEGDITYLELSGQVSLRLEDLLMGAIGVSAQDFATAA